jgi:hypothetical protein
MLQQIFIINGHYFDFHDFPRFLWLFGRFFYFIRTRPENQFPSLTFCYNHMLNVRQIHFYVELLINADYLSLLEFYDLDDLLVRHD